jgi:hypothetical protein
MKIGACPTLLAPDGANRPEEMRRVIKVSGHNDCVDSPIRPAGEAIIGRSTFICLVFIKKHSARQEPK